MLVKFVLSKVPRKFETVENTNKASKKNLLLAAIAVNYATNSLNSRFGLIDWFPVKNFTCKVSPVIVIRVPNSSDCWGRTAVVVKTTKKFGTFS